MSSALYRHRQKTIPVLPQTRSEVDLQDSWTQTADGRPYREDPEVCKWIRRAAGLPLLPQNKIQDMWFHAMDNTPDVPRAVAFNDYIVTTWVDHGARLPLPLWNHHGTTRPRTNNNLEGFHNRLNRGLPHRHPNIYRFVEVFRKVEQAERANNSTLEQLQEAGRECTERWRTVSAA
ncbi:uncharacterized protein [Haliotis cracherodii]|uniref:uncharacterized protein n=1 Tax=Haliotis cracherodii TaxID=6455 RepID=UPI0039E9B024